MSPYDTHRIRQHGRSAAIENNPQVEAEVLAKLSKQGRYIWLAAKRKRIRSGEGKAAIKRHWEFIRLLSEGLK